MQECNEDKGNVYIERIEDRLEGLSFCKLVADLHCVADLYCDHNLHFLNKKTIQL